MDLKTLNSINQEIRDYGKKVKTSTIDEHVMFLNEIGNTFKAVKGSEFDPSILTNMEIILDKIIDDTEDRRHKGKVDQTLLDALEQLIRLNSAMLRGAKKEKDISEDWVGQLRTYIKILRNLSIAALIITSNEFSEKASQSPSPKMKMIFDWGVKKYN